MSAFAHEPLLHLSTRDVVTAAIRDPKRHAHALRQPHHIAEWMFSYMDALQQKKAKQIALLTAPRQANQGAEQ